MTHASSPLPQADPPSFRNLRKYATHVANHGVFADFDAFMQQQDDAIKICFSVFEEAPVFVSQWLINQLKSDPTPENHTGILLNTLKWHPFEPYDKRPYPVEHLHQVVENINFSNLQSQHLDEIFRLMLQWKMLPRIEQNFAVFQPLIKHNREQVGLLAASHGLDIRPHISWTPSDRRKYFAYCCVGGLLDRARECAVPANEWGLLIRAFEMTLVHNPHNQPSLEYLWNTYPNTPWHESVSLLGTVLTNSNGMMDKVVDHFAQHAPHELRKIAEGMCAHALWQKKTALFDLMFPHVPAHQHPEVIGSAIRNRRKVVLKKLLALPTGVENFYAALEKCPPKDLAWATACYTTWQNKTLSKTVQTQPHKENRRALKL